MDENFFLYAYPALLVALFAAQVLLVVINLKSMAAVYRPLVSKKGLALLALIVLASFSIRLGLLRPRHVVYYDEFWHMDIAENFALGNALGGSLVIGPNGLRTLWPPAWPGGYHVLLGGVFKIFGAKEAVAFRFNEIVGALSVPLVFLLATAAFESQTSGLWAAFLLLTLPLHLRFSSTTDLTALSIFWILSTLLSLLLYLRTRKYGMYLLLLASLVYAANVRFENILLLPFCAFILWRHWSRRPLSSVRGYLLPLTLLVASIVPAIGISLLNRAMDVPGYADSIPGMLGNLSRILPGNILYLVRQPHKSLFLLPLATIAAIKARGAERKAILSILGLGAAYVLAASLHVNGSFLNGDTTRLALPWLVCLVLSASWSLKRWGDPARPLNCALFAVASLLLCWPTYAHAPPNPLDRELQLAQTTPLPPAALVVSDCPAFIWTAARRSSLHVSYLYEDAPAVLDDLDKTGSPLFLFKGTLWFRSSQASRRVEAQLQRRYRFEPAGTEQVDGNEYGFYHLVPFQRR